MSSAPLVLLWLLAGAGQEPVTLVGLPATIAAAPPPPARSFEPRLRMELVSLELRMTHDLVERFYRSGAPDPAADVGDTLLRGPEALLDGTLRCLSGLFPVSDAPPGVAERIFDYHRGAREGRLFTDFATHWINRERGFFSRFATDSGIDTAGFEDGTEDVDARGLMREQGKILWDAVRDTYLSKYKFRGEERIREDSFRVGEWSGADFAVLPPLMAGYVWWRGLEKRVSIGDTWLGVSIEPVSSWTSGSDDVVAGVSLEWGIKGLPVGVIVSAGRYDGKGELDFVGIGTSVGMVRHALGVRLGD